MSTAKPPKLVGAALAPLVYWLLLVAGLAGITFLRFSSYGSFVTADDVIALWAGSVVGVALGQGMSAARVRMWVPAVLAMFGFWFILPILFLVLDGIFGATAQTFMLAFLPASICGYLSLTERGALVAFWYPAVLWMIVILDGPAPGVFDTRFALPFVLGLAALFVVFLRARETRRVAIWKAHGNQRLAKAMPRTVLRGSPLRAATGHVWSAMVGAAALVLTAWIAPHLWQTTKDPQRAWSGAHGHHAARATASPSHCCPGSGKQREKVKEYFPLQNAHDTSEDEQGWRESTCHDCTYESALASTDDGRDWSYSGTPGSGLSTSPVHVEDTPSWSYSSYGSPSYSASPALTITETQESPPIPPPATTPRATAVQAPLATPAKTATSATPATKPSGVAGAGPVAATTLDDDASDVAPSARTGAIILPAPWKSSLALCTLVFALVLLSRATRRVLTLQHLVRPFWNEPLDQRISNHWQRMLIGLRDAGLEPSAEEQPQAFARRIGIDGMETCATILERVRHGVGVDVDDLATMATAADGVFRRARERAGAAARWTAWLRWPTA